MKLKNVSQNGGTRCAEQNMTKDIHHPITLYNNHLFNGYNHQTINNLRVLQSAANIPQQYCNLNKCPNFIPPYNCSNITRKLIQQSFYDGPSSIFIRTNMSAANLTIKSEFMENFPLPFNRATRKRHISCSRNLDVLLASLNLNEFSLPEVHLAMGKPGAASSISPAKEEYYRKIFSQLDVDNDGRIDVNELKQAYSEMGLLQIPGQAEKFVTASDRNKDGELDVTEFVKYLHEHEMKLQLMFKKIDRNKDGKISGHEIQQALKSVGITISNKETDDLMNKMDKDSTSTIDLDEWVQHHLLHPSTDIKDMVFYWRHAEYIDIGESLIVPDNFSAAEKESGYWLKTLIAGGVAGATSRTCTAPLDRLKVLMQVNSSKKFSIRSGFMGMLKEGGVKSFWRGNGINVLKIGPETAIKFATFERVKRIAVANPEGISTVERFMAGSIAGCTAQTCIYPMEVIKTRLAIRKTGQYTGIVDCATKIMKKEGPTAFFKGYLPNLLGIIPYAGIDLCVYETLKNRWMSKHVNDRPSNWLVVGCGMISSTCGQLASYPLALVRTKMQAQAMVDSNSNNEIKQGSMVSHFKEILKNDGLPGLYRGILPNFMKVMPAVSISYVVYEQSKGYLGIQKGRS